MEDGIIVVVFEFDDVVFVDELRGGCIVGSEEGCFFDRRSG